MKNVIAKTINNDTVSIYDPNGELIIATNNELVFTDIRVQIKNKKLSGYYIVFNGVTIPIDCRGTPKHWPDGLFDKFSNLLMQLL